MPLFGKGPTTASKQPPVELVGASSLGPLLLVGSKALLVSCVDTEQADLACAAIDCGFLLAVGSLSAVVVRDGNRAGKLDALVDPLMQVSVGKLRRRRCGFLQRIGSSAHPAIPTHFTNSCFPYPAPRRSCCSATGCRRSCQARSGPWRGTST